MEKQHQQQGASGDETSVQSPPSDSPMNYDIVNNRYFLGLRGKALRRQISFAGAFGFLLFGYDQGVLGGLNAAEEFLRQFNNPSSSLLGTINAIYEIGCFCGALTVFFFGEAMGRKKCLYVGALLMFIGAALQASAFGVPQMIIGRIVCGWGNGFNTATTPLWVSELVPPKSRGRHVAIQGNLIAFGIVLAYYFNIALSYTSGALQWRTPIAAQGILILAQFLWVYYLPESPRWLTKHNRHGEAIDVIRQLVENDVDHDHPSVIQQKREIDEAIRIEEADGPFRWTEMFKNGPLKIRRRFLLVIGLQAFQQLSGINVLVYYMPHTLTTDIGYDYRTALHIAAGCADAYWIFSFIGVLFLDQMGRRPPLIWGSIVSALCFLVSGLLQKDITPVRAKASLAFFFLYEAVFAIGWLPVPWLYGAEFMPLRHRTHSAALATASDWIFNYLIVQITPISISNIRWKTYMIFFVLNIAFCIIVWLFYPETSGRTLEEMDQIYLGDNDRLIVVDGKGRLLPGFRSRMNRTHDFGAEESDGKPNTKQRE
ncbi:general substrate transporter [Ilyonectria destructans]|nr:general substrate transporter [Ilyonectria destructans]